MYKCVHFATIDVFLPYRGVLMLNNAYAPYNKTTSTLKN